jgi:hypothetical protein
MSTAVDSLRVGGAGEPSTDTADAVMKYSADFPDTITAENAALVGFETTPYADLGLPVGDYDAVKGQIEALRDRLHDRQAFLRFIAAVEKVLSSAYVGQTYAAEGQRIEQEVAEATKLLKDCGHSPPSCQIPGDLTRFVKPLIFMPNIFDVPCCGEPVLWEIDEPGRRLRLAGIYCWAPNACFANGVGNYDPNYVLVQVNGESRRWDGQPISLPTLAAGEVNYVVVRVVDTDFSDNKSGLKGVFY